MPIAVEFSTLAEMFERVTKKFEDNSRPVLMHKTDGRYRSISYKDLRSQVHDFALGLASAGVVRGDRIAMISENRPEWVVADFGMVLLGAVNVSLFPTLTAKQIEFILNDAGVKVAIVSNQFQLKKVLSIIDHVPTLQKVIVMSESGDLKDQRTVSFTSIIEAGAKRRGTNPSVLDGTVGNVRSEDILTLIYTSGTTGNPKGVMLTHGNLVSNIVASAACIPFGEEDTMLSFLPLSHSYERMAGYYTAFACGATIAYAESIETVRDNLTEVCPTIVTTVPRLFERIHNRLMKQIESQPPIRQKIFHWAIRVGRKVAARRKRGGVPFWLGLQHTIADRLVFGKIRARTGGRIRFFVSGGAALSRELGEFFEAIGIQIIEGYGLTESSPVITVNRPEEYKFGTVGKPIPGVEIRIAEDGEVLARGPNIMRGYWNNPESTAEMIDADGWLHTGDIGIIDNEGFLAITDRKKHLFVSSGGKNIAPQPIENLFLQSPLVDQFVLIGDGRMYLTALVVPEFDGLAELARRKQIHFSSPKDLACNVEVRKIYEDEFGRIQRDLANYERVRRFTLLDRPLTIDDGELTPTMKIRRRVVEDRYRVLIDEMYSGVG